MKCPNCDHEIELAWQTIRRARRALGQCAGCGEPSVSYRCLECRKKIADARRQSREQKQVQCTQLDSEKRSA